MKNYKYILTHSSSNLTPVYSPLNWDKFNILFKRSERYHSILRNQIVDSDFPFDGKAYIDNIYETYGIDTEIGCEIQYLIKQTGAYATLLEGVIDLSEWSSLRDTTSVKIIDSSVLASFAARDEMEIALNKSTNLDGAALSSYTYLEGMFVEGVDIEEKAQWIDADNEILITTMQDAEFHVYRGITADDYNFNTIGVDAVLPAVTLITASGVLYTNNTGASQTIRYRVKTSVSGDVTVVASNTWAWMFRAFVGINDGGGWEATNTVIIRSASGSSGDFRGITATYDSGYVEETLAGGETLEMYHYWNGEATGGDTITPDFVIAPIHVEVFTVQTGKGVTQVNMPMVHELGAKLLEIMTGVADPLNAPLLGRTDSEPRVYGSDGDYSLEGVASGLMLRGFPFDDQPLKTTFADYFKTLDALFNLGLWYDASAGEFVIAAKEDFYKDSNIITLGEVQELEKSVAVDHYFNEVLAGYPKVDYEETNGQSVPNVPVTFANDGKMIKNTLDLRSPYRGDDYGIELSRKADYATTAGDDTRYDNDNFIIQGRRPSVSIYTAQGYDTFTTITGVYAPSTRLNLDISPKRNLLRNASLLSIPAFISNSDVQFMQSQFELNLKTTKLGDPEVNEVADISYLDLEEPLYYPEIYNFTAELTMEIILQLFSDPHGYVTFEYLGVKYGGYILEVSSEPFNRVGNWTLIKRNPNRT